MKAAGEATRTPRARANAPVAAGIWALAALLLLLFLCQNVLEMRRESCTSDEVVHLPAGYSYLVKRDFRMNPEHPPLVKILSALPLLLLHPKTVFEDPSWSDPKGEYLFGYKFLYANDPDLLLFWGRMPVTILATLLGFFVFRWTQQLFGVWPGIFALGLYSFSPNIIAHAHLVTMDLAVSAFLFISFYFLWRHLEKRESRSLYVSALTAGMAMASKFSAVVLFPIALLLLWAWSRTRNADLKAIAAGPAPKGRSARGSRHKGRPVKTGWRVALVDSFRYEKTKLTGILIYCGLAALVVQLTYIGSIDPALFFKGLLQVNKNHDPNYPFYLHGSVKLGGWWYYFAEAFLVKATAPFVVLVITSMAVFARRFRQMTDIAAFLWLPALVLFGATSLLADPIGIRYLLPVFPFLMVISGGLLSLRPRWKMAGWVLWGLLGWHVTSSLAAFPDHIPYFNELAGGASHGTDWLDDSNVDWGQELKVLKRVLDEQGIGKITLLSFSPFDNPEYYGIHCVVPRGQFRVESGYYAVSAHVYVRWKLNGFDWKEHSKLVTEVGHSMFVFRVS